MSQANFIPAHRLNAKGRRLRVRRWVVACSAYGLILLTAYGGSLAVWSKDARDLTHEKRDVSEKVSRSQQALSRLQEQVANAELELQANRAVGSQPDWSVLLTAISADLGEETFLRRCQLSPTDADPPGGAGAGDIGARAGKLPTAAERKYVLKISGSAKSHAAVSQFVLRLEQNGLFDQVRVVKTAREPLLAASAIGFELECSLGKEVARAP